MSKSIHYHITLHRADVVLKLTYRYGTFQRLERVRGKLTQEIITHIGKVIPMREKDIPEHFENLPNVTAETLNTKPKTQFAKYSELWFAFYTKFAGIPPKFTGADGKHLKQIITYLEQVEGNPERALAIWNAVLTNWHTLSEFHRKNTDLKYINSQLNKILNELKNSITDPSHVFHSAVNTDAGRNFKFK